MGTIALVILCYLIGSLSFAVIVSRACGLPDPRSYGSAIRVRPMSCAAAKKRLPR